jgi:hypothetical protein
VLGSEGHPTGNCL